MKKGDRIRETRTNPDEMFKNTTANMMNVYEITRVNPKTYSVRCVEGTLKGMGCYLKKTAVGKTFLDVYGTKTVLEAI